MNKPCISTWSNNINPSSLIIFFVVHISCYKFTKVIFHEFHSKMSEMFSELCLYFLVVEIFSLFFCIQELTAWCMRSLSMLCNYGVWKKHLVQNSISFNVWLEFLILVMIHFLNLMEPRVRFKQYSSSV